MTIRLLQQVTTRNERALPQSLTRDTITDPAHVQVAAELRTGRAGVGVLVGVDPDDDVNLFDKTGARLAPGRVPESPPGPGRIVAGGSRP